MAGQTLVIVWAIVFLLEHDPFLAGQISTVITLAIVNLDCKINHF